MVKRPQLRTAVAQQRTAVAISAAARRLPRRKRCASPASRACEARFRNRENARAHVGAHASIDPMGGRCGNLRLGLYTPAKPSRTEDATDTKLGQHTMSARAAAHAHLVDVHRSHDTQGVQGEGAGRNSCRVAMRNSSADAAKTTARFDCWTTLQTPYSCGLC